jgi:hypothetical protein
VSSFSVASASCAPSGKSQALSHPLRDSDFDCGHHSLLPGFGKVNSFPAPTSRTYLWEVSFC